MLILTRKPAETIIIGKDAAIKIHILGVKGNQVRIGVDAPKGVDVHREEIFLKIKEESDGTKTEDINKEYIFHERGGSGF